MKRILIIVLLSAPAFSSIGSVSDAKRRSGRARAVATPSGKVEIHCPTPLNDITDCMRLDPDTGCGSLDPNLNEQKNIRSKGGGAEAMTLQDLTPKCTSKATTTIFYVNSTNSSVKSDGNVIRSRFGRVFFHHPCHRAVQRTLNA